MPCDCLNGRRDRMEWDETGWYAARHDRKQDQDKNWTGRHAR